jgi:competence protein ComEA
VPSFTLSRRQALISVACLLAVVFAVAHAIGKPKPSSPVGDPGSSPASVVPPLAVPAATSSAIAALVVDVAGAVRRPGLYRLPQGSRIADALARAGGTTRRADPNLVNLAAPLADGEQVLVPVRAGTGAAAASAPGPPSPSAPVDLNSATVEQLDALPGVGPVTAQKIVDYRQQHGPFTSVDGLDAIPGIGPARVENLRGLVIP